MSAKWYQLLNKFITLTNTKSFLLLFVLSSIMASVTCAIIAIRHSWMLWITTISFLLQAVWAVKVLLPHIVAKRKCTQIP